MSAPRTDGAADAAVRLARTSDVDDIAAVQVAAWRAAYAGVLPAEALESLDTGDIAARWGKAILLPPPGAHRVLVALAGTDLVGFAATAPAGDGDLDPQRDGELVALAVHPDHQRAGHGSRLMTAAADHLIGDGFDSAVTWAPVADEPRRAFLRSAGWGPDGAFRDLRVDDEATVREVRLVTSFVE
jgi:ribosomal protein S18 acetylase RimI-like enzyme